MTVGSQGIYKSLSIKKGEPAMTSNLDCTVPDEFLEPMLKNDLGAQPELICLVMNAKMGLR